MTSPYYGERGALPPADTPPGAEARLEAYRDELDVAREALRQARDDEVKAKEARDEARRRAQFDPDCPPVGVFNGVRTTVAYQTAWIEDRIADQEHEYQLKKLARQAASEHLRTLGKQGSFQQSLTKSIGDDWSRNIRRWGA